MKKRIQFLSFLATLAIAMGMISWGSTLHAQNAPSSNQQSPNTTQQQPPTPETPPTAQQPPSSQTPDANAPDSGSRPSSQATPSDSTAGDTQTFSGTVMKKGDKYMLKDDSGKMYDIDHQTDVAKFEGKRVRVQGTLDANGKILVK